MSTLSGAGMYCVDSTYAFIHNMSTLSGVGMYCVDNTYAFIHICPH